MSIYEIGLLGDIADADRDIISSTISRLAAEFSLEVGKDVSIRFGDDFANRDKHAAATAAYFGGAAQVHQAVAQAAIAASLPVIPTVPADGDFGAMVPPFLQSANGLRRRRDDPEASELGLAILECIGLLRRQRRAFVSYRRIESRNAAIQLHDLLSARGFDVFLDTHDILPGEPFQEVLWHRLCDSDVMVMLDTPTYFESKWTRQELGRARAKEIHVLRVVWPGHTPNLHTDFGETIYLDQAELAGGDGPIVEDTVDRIVLAVERLRSRSIASRYMSITGKLRAEVAKIGGEIEGIGVHRAISMRLQDHTKLWAYPIVGIPTAELLNDVVNKAQRAEQQGRPFLVYDHIGIHEQWNQHLKWLDENISSVRAIRVAEAGWMLAGWE
ncbi:MAG TPA: toll/interleukin-1 receptor domain-containing protein [Dongiaceae bacterium]|nr:toll/interleukin-1 receptor domain-containing protein [Dongiaceae bacterium]